MIRAQVACLLLALLGLTFTLAGGCPPESTLAGIFDGTAGDDATADETWDETGGDDATTGDDNVTEEESEAAFEQLSEPVEGDDALYDASSAAAPTLSDDDLAAINDALASDTGSEESISSDVQVPIVTARPGIVAALGRVGAVFTETGPTSEDPNQAGSFEGIWLARDGSTAGTIAGSYASLSTGELPAGFSDGGTFAGRYFDTTGVFQGVLLGRWGRTADGKGFFRGQWRDENGELLGVLKGQWRFNEAGDGGVFFGRWAAFNLCDEVATLPAYEFDDADTGGLTPTDETLADSETGDDASTPVLSETDAVLTDESLCLDTTKPYGFIRGTYRPYDPNAAVDANQPIDPNFDGIVRCLWRNSDGEVIGALVGRWEALETSATAQDVSVAGRFYGKYLDTSGNFVGFVRGAYGRSFHGLGVFRGEYFDENGAELGWLVGRWRVGVGRPGGPVFGLWNSTAAQ